MYKIDWTVKQKQGARVLCVSTAEQFQFNSVEVSERASRRRQMEKSWRKSRERKAEKQNKQIDGGKNAIDVQNGREKKCDIMSPVPLVNAHFELNIFILHCMTVYLPSRRLLALSHSVLSCYCCECVCFFPR